MDTSHKASRLAAISIALAGIVSILPSAQAETPSAAHSVAVSYAHLDLGTSTAMDALFRQLAIAAERACGTYEARDLRQRNDWRDCRDSAFGGAIAQVVEARLAAVQHDTAPAIATVAANL